MASPPLGPPSSPSMSGNESFAKTLFAGVPAEGLIFPYPVPSRGEVDELNALLEGVRRLGGKPIDREGALSHELLRAARELGLFGLVVPKSYGGTGLRMTPYARVVQDLASLDASLAMNVSAHQSLGLAALLNFGGEELKARYLPRCARGEKLAAFALVEEGAGSDAGAVLTRAVRRGEGFVLDGEKSWVTSGGIADLFTVFARTSPAEDGAKPKLTAFFIERQDGVTSGPEEPMFGMRGTSTTSLKLSSVYAEDERVLGTVGRGYKVAMEVLTSARIALAAIAIGMGKRLLRLAVERAKKRKTFGRRIEEFGLIKDKIATMAADIFALESMTYLTTGLIDAGCTDYSIESAICKVFGSEALWRVANESALIGGSLAYTQRGPWERLLRDARAPLVFEGTNEILRCFVALSGMQGASRELAEVPSAIREPIKGFGLLGDFALRKAKTMLSRDRLTRAHPLLTHESSLVVTYSHQLAKYIDKVLRRHGKNIAEMQYTQRRVAEIAIDLYALSSIVARTTRIIERRGEEGARRELDLAAMFARAAERRLAENVASFDDNDDELRKAIAERTCTDGGYPLDIL